MRGLDTRIKTLEAEACRRFQAQEDEDKECYIGGNDGSAYNMDDVIRFEKGDFPHIGRDGKTYFHRGINPDFVHGKITLRDMATQAGVAPVFCIDDQPKNSLVWPEDDYREYCLLDWLDSEGLRYAEYAPKGDEQVSILRAKFDDQHLKVWGMTEDERWLKHKADRAEVFGFKCSSWFANAKPSRFV